MLYNLYVTSSFSADEYEHNSYQNNAWPELLKYEIKWKKRIVQLHQAEVDSSC